VKTIGFHTSQLKLNTKVGHFLSLSRLIICEAWKCGICLMCPVHISNGTLATMICLGFPQANLILS